MYSCEARLFLKVCSRVAGYISVERHGAVPTAQQAISLLFYMLPAKYWFIQGKVLTFDFRLSTFDI